MKRDGLRPCAQDQVMLNQMEIEAWPTIQNYQLLGARGEPALVTFHHFGSCDREGAL